MSTSSKRDLVLSKLEALKSSLSRCFDNAMKRIEMVENGIRNEGMQDEVGGAFNTFPLDISPEMEKTHIDTIEELETKLTCFNRKLQCKLEPLVAQHFKLDVGSLFEVGVGEVVRSFRPIAAEITQEELASFIKGENNGEDLRLFLKVGADINGLVSGQSALMKAVAENHEESLMLLLDDNPDLEVKSAEGSQRPGSTVLMFACDRRRWRMAKSLLNSGASVSAVAADGLKIVQAACKVQFSFMPDFDNYVNLREQEEVICEITKRMSSSEMEDLTISKSSGVGRYPLLHFAVENNFMNLAEVCLYRGHDINAVDDNDNTALHCAVKQCVVDGVAFLLRHGADVRLAGFQGKTALHYICDSSVTAMLRWSRVEVRQEILEMLLSHGSPVNALDALDRTPLRALAQTSDALRWEALMSVLLEHGASLHTRNRYGVSVYDYLQGEGLLSRLPERFRGVAQTT